MKAGELWGGGLLSMQSELKPRPIFGELDDFSELSYLRGQGPLGRRLDLGPSSSGCQSPQPNSSGMNVCPNPKERSGHTAHTTPLSSRIVPPILLSQDGAPGRRQDERQSLGRKEIRPFNFHLEASSC